MINLFQIVTIDKTAAPLKTFLVRAMPVGQKAVLNPANKELAESLSTKILTPSNKTTFTPEELSLLTALINAGLSDAEKTAVLPLLQ